MTEEKQMIIIREKEMKAEVANAIETVIGKMGAYKEEAPERYDVLVRCIRGLHAIVRELDAEAFLSVGKRSGGATARNWLTHLVLGNEFQTIGNAKLLVRLIQEEL